MVNFSAHPISVDGIRLDTLAWGIETQTYSTGGLVAGDLALPGLDGTVPSMLDARSPSLLTIGMVVRGADADGRVPAGKTAVQTLRENLDTLLALFGQTHRLLDVREVVDPAASGTVGTRQAMAKVVDAFAPELSTGLSARMTVNLTIPGVYWRDVATQDWAQTAVKVATDYTIPVLARGSGPVLDAIVALTGPINDPAIVDVTSGHKVRLPGPLPAGQTWRLNVGTWESRTGTGLALASADTAGTSRAGDTETVGLAPYLLPLRPSVVAGIPQTRVRLEGTGLTTATTLRTRTRRAYL